MNQPQAPGTGIVEAVKTLSATAVQTGRLDRLGAKLHRLLDSKLTPLPQIRIDCKEGCASCCYRLVESSLPEAMAAAEFIVTQLEPAEKERIENRLRAYMADVLRFYRRESNDCTGACPFLENDRCSIYEARPLSCRAVFSQDVDRCRAWRDTRTDPPFMLGPVGLADQMISAAVEATYKAGAPSGRFNFPAAVLSLLENGPEAAKRDGLTAEVERFAMKSPVNDGKYGATPGFDELERKPGFTEFLTAIRAGQEKTYRAGATRLQDGILDLYAGLALPSQYESQDELEERWAELDKALEVFESAKLDPVSAYDRLPTLCPFYWPYTGKDVRPYLERLMQKLYRDVVSKVNPREVAPIEGKRRPGKFRLGYISSNMGTFSGSYWAAGWMENHSKEIETFAINLYMTEDPYTNYWRYKADHYFHMPIHPTEAAPIIRSFDLDAMIFTDFQMYYFDHPLACMRLARRQFTGWGHPITTGSPAIDFYLSGELMEPENADAHYSERLVRLPGTGLCYPRAFKEIENVDLARFGLPESGFILDVQTSAKRIPRFDELYRQVCEATGKPIAMVLPMNEGDHKVFVRRMKNAGVNAIFIPRLSVGEYFGLVSRAGVLLDTPSFNGGITTLDALRLRKAVVTLPTEFMRGRQAAGFLKKASVPGLIAKDFGDYVDLVANEARRAEALATLDSDALYEDKAPVRSLDNLLLEGFEE